LLDRAVRGIDSGHRLTSLPCSTWIWMVEGYLVTGTTSRGNPTNPRSEDAARARSMTSIASLPSAAPDQSTAAATPRWVRRIRAWMLVLPVDGLMVALPAVADPQQWKAQITTAIITILLITGGRSYRARLQLSVLDELPGLVARLLVATAIVATVIALRHDQDAVTSFLNQSLPTLALLIAGRVLTTQIILWARRRVFVAHSTLIVGGGPVAAELVDTLGRCPQYGLRVVGFVADPCGSVVAGAPFLGPLEAMEIVATSLDPGVILVVDAAAEEPVLEFVRRPDVRIRDLLIVPRLHQLQTQAGLPDHIGSIPILRINPPRLSGPAKALKRGIDILVAVVLLVALSPVLGACALAVRLEGGGHALFRQDRVGRNGRIFRCLKFRSLKALDSTESATHWSVANDVRVGPVGRFLRRSSLDELPQLWNILRGDMTLVGPRPERPYFVEKFSTEIPRYKYRHRVPAGLTGLAQINGLRGDTSIADRVRFDNYYIECWSLWLDAKILLRTFAEVIFARGR
jgi:exopolysaccharide biosynthesis polyprenyl glycosylphosphotransferase